MNQLCEIPTLQTLKLDGNRITTLEFLEKYQGVTQLSLADNAISDLSQLAYLSYLFDLKSLQIRGNPATSYEKNCSETLKNEVLKKIEVKLLALPLLELAHVDTPDIRLPSKVEFGLQLKDLPDFWNVRPVVQKFKEQFEACSNAYSGQFLEIVAENRRKVDASLKERRASAFKSGCVDELDALVQKMDRERLERREMLRQLGVLGD